MNTYQQKFQTSLTVSQEGTDWQLTASSASPTLPCPAQSALLTPDEPRVHFAIIAPDVKGLYYVTQQSSQQLPFSKFKGSSNHYRNKSS